MVYIIAVTTLGKCQPRWTGDGPNNGGFKFRIRINRTGMEIVHIMAASNLGKCQSRRTVVVHIMAASSLGKCQPRRTVDVPYNGRFKFRQM